MKLTIYLDYDYLTKMQDKTNWNISGHWRGITTDPRAEGRTTTDPRAEGRRTTTDPRAEGRTTTDPRAEQTRICSS